MGQLDPVEHTVLANEQVIDGRGWRSGALVERRLLPQWFFRITRYAGELLEALDRLPRWPERVKTMQRNWIGRSEGALMRFQVVGNDQEVEVFTTRPDTIFGATFIALSPDHPLSRTCADTNPAVDAFIRECTRDPGRRDHDAAGPAGKTGVDTGLHVQHPFLERSLRVFVADYVLMEYGTGAIFAVPRMTSATSTLPAPTSLTWRRSSNRRQALSTRGPTRRMSATARS